MSHAELYRIGNLRCSSFRIFRDRARDFSNTLILKVQHRYHRSETQEETATVMQNSLWLSEDAFLPAKYTPNNQTNQD
jgi:hypothetical protein